MGEGVYPSMGKEERIKNKVKHLLKRFNIPKWLHHFGPKTYELYEHLVALLIKSYGEFSYRRTVKFMRNMFGMVCPSKSALQSTAKKIPKWIWDKALELTSGIEHEIIAIDSTGFSRTNPSYHYLRRIDGKMPQIPVKLSGAYDTNKKKFCAAKIRVLPAHDIKDAKFLLFHSGPKIAVADKGYNAEHLFRFAAENNMQLMVPSKSNAKRGFYRKKAQEKFRLRTYHRRELVESGNSSIKRCYGSSVSSRKARTIRTEVYGRLACHNLFGWLFRLLGQSRFGDRMNLNCKMFIKSKVF